VEGKGEHYPWKKEGRRRRGDPQLTHFPPMPVKKDPGKIPNINPTIELKRRVNHIRGL